MRRLSFLMVLAMLFTSCISLQNRQTLSDLKADLDCIPYREGLEWKHVAGKFGTPSITPIPEAGTDLSKNTRGYKGKTILFFTERKEVSEDGKTRFHEVVTAIEICKPK